MGQPFHVVPVFIPPSSSFIISSSPASTYVWLSNSFILHSIPFFSQSSCSFTPSSSFLSYLSSVLQSSSSFPSSLLPNCPPLCSLRYANPVKHCKTCAGQAVPLCEKICGYALDQVPNQSGVFGPYSGPHAETA